MEDEGGGGGIEETSSRLMGSSGGESRWVDGSEMDSDSPPWSLFGDDEGREGYGSIRRRLVKKPKRADSFDVEAMEIAGSHAHDSKAMLCFFAVFLLTHVLFCFYVSSKA